MAQGKRLPLPRAKSHADKPAEGGAEGGEAADAVEAVEAATETPAEAAAE